MLGERAVHRVDRAGRVAGRREQSPRQRSAIALAFGFSAPAARPSRSSRIGPAPSGRPHAISASMSTDHRPSVIDPRKPRPLDRNDSRTGLRRSCAAIGSPVHSSTEASTVVGSMAISGLAICSATSTASTAATRAGSSSPFPAANSDSPHISHRSRSCSPWSRTSSAVEVRSRSASSRLPAYHSRIARFEQQRSRLVQLAALARRLHDLLVGRPRRLVIV